MDTGRSEEERAVCVRAYGACVRAYGRGEHLMVF